MKNNVEFSKKINHRYTILCISIIFIILNCLYLNSYDDYYDDWNFFYTVDSNINDQETWQRHYGGDRGDYILREAYPWVFTYFIKYILKFIGYSVENTHYILLSFSILSVFAFYKLSSLLSKDFKFKIIVMILFCLNLFLIRELNSFRPHSPTLFLSLVSSYFYIKIFVQNLVSKKNYFIYFLTTFLMITIWPQSLAIFAGQIAFSIIFFSYSKKNLVLPAIFIFYVLINIDYIFYLTVDFEWGYTPFEKKFFVNYFFRSFFGSIVFGGFMLIMFAYFLIKKLLSFNFNLKFNFNSFKKKELNPINYFLIIILTIYSACIAYSLLKTSVMAPKYFIPLLPIIILWIGYNIYLTRSNFLLYGTIVLTIINCIYFWNDLPIDRPPMREALQIVNEKNIKKIFTTESIGFNNYLSNYNYTIKNKIKIIHFKNLEKKTLDKSFAILCLNYPRFEVGNSYINKVEPTCKNVMKNVNLEILNKIRISDFIIFITKYKY